jgi:DNA-binding response OmpR family regulator
VLLVEDERSIRELVSDQLRRSGYDCLAVSDGREGLQRLLEEPFDAVVLDLMLPHVDGVTICRTIRRQGVNRDAPILMLTARMTESDKVLGLESGADDYVTKPFGVLELTARIGALTRRVHRAQGQPATPLRGEVIAHGVVLSRKELLAAVWRGQAFVTDRSIDTLVRHLRCKVEEDPAAPRLIITVWGYGYKFADA